MIRPPLLGIDHLTINGLPPPDLLHLAAEAGCASVGLLAERLDSNPFGFAEWSLVRDPSLRRETRRLAEDLGLAVALGEGCAVRPERDVAECLPVIEAFADLGAARLNLLSFEPDPAREVDQMARFAELAHAAGLAVCAEFSARPGRPRLPEFLARIAAAGAPGVTALIDAMHFFAAGQHPADLAAIAPERIGYLQLCDARLGTIDDYAAAALNERLCPGDGTLPLADLIAALPSGIVVSMEIPQVSAGGLEAQRARVLASAERCRALLG